MDKKVRSSNIELLRIICMLLVVAHHCVIHGGGYAMENCLNKWLSLVFIPAGKICFDTFVVISVWFMVDAEFKASRFVRIWFTVLFYNVVFMLFTRLLGNGYASVVGRKHFLGALFPIIGNSHGYAAAYTLYCLILPFLKIIGKHLTQKTAAIMAGILILTQSLCQLFGGYIGYVQPMSSEILLFVMFYYIAFYLKNWPLKVQECKPFLAGILIVIWGGLCAVWYLNAKDPTNTLFAFIRAISGSEFSINNIIAGFALFLLVKDVKIPHIPFVNVVASTTLGVLLYHDHNYFRPVVWHRMIKAETWYYVSTPRYLAYLALATLTVFGMGVILDLMRQKIIEKPFMKTRIYQTMCARIDDIFYTSD